MKSLKTYIPSLILSVLLIFSLLGTSALIIVKCFASSDKLISIAEENDVTSKVSQELESYFKERYNETGIPAEIYMDALDDNYISSIVNYSICEGINILNNAEYEKPDKKNEKLEQNIESFFDEYADSINYVKDDVYEEKLNQTIDDAYNVIINYSDVYKFRTMNDEGILTKAGGIYRQLDVIILAAAGASLLLIIIILLINIKSVSAALYWTGVSSLVSGIIGLVPCIYLNAVNYFDSFVIKQPQIFTAFTSLMKDGINALILNQVIFAAAGLVLIIAFIIIPKKNRQETKRTA